MNELLIRYWIEFDPADLDEITFLKCGCGITAYNVGDMHNFLEQIVFKNTKVPRIVNIIENVDVSKLDEDHIIPAIGVCSNRGVWFPYTHPEIR